MRNRPIQALVTSFIYLFVLAGCSSISPYTTYFGSAYFQGVKTRLKQGVDINASTNENADTFLHISTLNNNVGEVGYLLNRGANPNKTNKAGFPPLFYIQRQQETSNR